MHSAGEIVTSLYTVPYPEKESEYLLFRHNFEHFGHCFVIFDINHPDISAY